MEELQHKYRFVMEVLSHMGLPLMDEKIIAYTEKFAADISEDERKKMTQKLFSKNFVLHILGQLTSLFGNFILKLALSMYVLDTTLLSEMQTGKQPLYQNV